MSTTLVIATLIIAIAAIVQTAITRAGIRRQLRAYVVGESGTIVNVANPVPAFTGQVINPTGAEIANLACGPIAYIQIKNAGQTPAYDVIHWGDVCIREYPLTSDLPSPPINTKMASILGPGIPSTKILFLQTHLTSQQDSDLRAGKIAIYVHGIISYKDAFGQKRFTKYRLMHHSGQGAIGVSTTLSFADEGNEAN